MFSNYLVEAKDVLSNMNHMQADERDKNAVFSTILSLMTLTFDCDLQTHSSPDQTRLLCEFGANPFSGYRDILYTNKN